ncbi:hypothetical protein FRC15_007962, partial [Serendipita sp. 397]
MWRYIHIDLKSISQINSLFPSLGQVSLPRWAILAIERSGACPLELSFSNLGSDNALEVVRSLICANGALASRVERLEIGLAGQSYLPLLAVIQVAKTSNIRSVMFYHTGYFTVHETLPTETLETLQTAEMLESLALGRIQWLSPSGYTLPKVTSLSIDLGHNHEALLLQSLSAFPNLIELCLECTDHVKLTDSWEPIPACTLPHLRTIAFDPRICHYSLHKLEAPVLDTIIAKNFSRLSPRFLEALPSRPTYSRLRLVNFVPMPDIMTGLGEGRAVGGNTTWSSYKTLEMLKVEWTMHFKAGVAGFIECLRNHLEI